MADFNEAFKFTMSFEGTAVHHAENVNSDEILLCSNCFFDEGLKLNALMVGIASEEKCPNCGSTEGHKLNKDLVQKLCYRFFVRGTIQKLKYGGAPLIQFNEHNANNSSIDVSNWLVNDLKLIEKAGGVGFFYYGPRLWMVGEIEPLKALQSEEGRSQIIDKILQVYPAREISDKQYFYRLRKNPGCPDEPNEYDTAPDAYLGQYRFDAKNFPILYGSPDLELCVHECRTTVEDELYVAKLVPTRNLLILDLSALVDEDGTEFESLDLAVHFLFLAGDHSYVICREIARRAKEQGFDGIIYPSYFSNVRTGETPFDTMYGMSIRKLPPLKDYAQSQSIPNVALFGRPVEEKKVVVQCINKVIINQVSYNLSFGPAYHRAYGEIDENAEITSQ